MVPLVSYTEVGDGSVFFGLPGRGGGDAHWLATTSTVRRTRWVGFVAMSAHLVVDLAIAHPGVCSLPGEYLEHHDAKAAWGNMNKHANRQHEL